MPFLDRTAPLSIRACSRLVWHESGDRLFFAKEFRRVGARSFPAVPAVRAELAGFDADGGGHVAEAAVEGVLSG